MNRKPFVLFIVGPTASGKSNIALQAATRFGGEIINADSIQFYKGLDIGSAKPTQDELRRVRHHLVDVAPMGSSYTAADFRRDALKVIEERSLAGQRMFYVVGGSGFYIQSLLKGMYQIPKVPDEIHNSVRLEPVSKLFAELISTDPEYAQLVSPNDEYRIRRAMEVIRFTNKTFTYYRQDFQGEKFPYPHRVVGIHSQKPILKERIIERTRNMILHGLIAETKNLLNMNLQNWAPLRSVGYNEICNYLDGKIQYDQIQDEITNATMRLVKKQMTWFKREPDTIWFDANHGSQAMFNFIGEIVSYVNPSLAYEMSGER